MGKLITIVATVFFLGCTSSQDLISGNDKRSDTAEAYTAIKNSFPVSGRTRLFIGALNTELKASGKSINKYTPSATLIEEYQLSKTNSGYMLSGFVKTSEKFSDSQFGDVNVTLGKPAGNIRTIHIPLAYFPDFLQQQEITYFEISNRLH